MGQYTKYGVAAIMMSALTAAPALAGSHGAHDVVRDKHGKLIHNSFGNCVRTKWEAGHDACQNTKPYQSPRTVVREHDRSYLVFFDFDRYNLTTDAKGVLSELVERTGDSLATSYEVVGHADRSGSDAYNIRLSQRRANSVKQELIRLGAKPSNISIDWKGEAEPLVPTNDGIREPQNRRATIGVTTEEIE